MKFKRLIRHLAHGKVRLRKFFPESALKKIETAIANSEAKHRGELRFVVEVSFDPAPIWRNVTARERAVDLFSSLRIWDTEENTGVLIYLLLADRDIEIVADRGINRIAGTETWEKICKKMEERFRAGEFEGGVLEGIETITQLLTEHFPHSGDDENELSNRPLII